jgi:hypothetical protein
LKQHLLLKKKKKSMYVTKWYKQSPLSRYWPQQSCWVSRTFTKQEKEKKFQIVYLNGVYAYTQTWSCISNWNM